MSFCPRSSCSVCQPCWRTASLQLQASQQLFHAGSNTSVLAPSAILCNYVTVYDQSCEVVEPARLRLAFCPLRAIYVSESAKRGLDANDPDCVFSVFKNSEPSCCYIWKRVTYGDQTKTC